MRNRSISTLKTMMHRTMAVLLCTCMISSSVSITSFAEEQSIGSASESDEGNDENISFCEGKEQEAGESKENEGKEQEAGESKENEGKEQKAGESKESEGKEREADESEESEGKEQEADESEENEADAAENDEEGPVWDAEGCGMTFAGTTYTSLQSSVSFDHVYSESDLTADVYAYDQKDEKGAAAYYFYADTSGELKSKEELDQLGDSVWIRIRAAGNPVKYTLCQEAGTERYIVYAYAVDDSGNRSSYVCTNGFVIDLIAPFVAAVTAPDKAAGTLTDEAAQVGIRASENGTTVYYRYAERIDSLSEDASDYVTLITDYTTLITTGTAQEGAQTLALTDVSNQSEGTITLESLSPSTEYHVWYVLVDRAGNASDVQKMSFTTTKAMPKITVAPKLEGSYGKKVSELALTGGLAQYNGASIAGTWKVTDSQTEDIPVVGTKQEYQVTFTPDNDSYEAVTVKVIPDITKKAVTVTADDCSRAYGEENPAFTFTVPEGTLEGTDSKTELGVTLSCAAAKDSPVKAGGYEITGTANSQNYNVTVTPGTLTIEQADPELKVTNGDSSAAANKVSFIKTIADETFTIDAVSKNKTTPITYKVTNSRTIDGNQPVSDDEVVTVDAKGKVTIKGTGRADIIVSQAAGTNYKAAESYTAEITVNRKAAPADITVTKNYKKGKTAADTLNIKPYLPKDCGSASYAYGFSGWMIDSKGNGGTDPAVTDGVLSYTIKSEPQSGSSGTESNEGTLTVTVKTSNYEKFDIILKVKLTDYDPIAISAVSFSGVKDTSAKVTAKAAKGSNPRKYYLYFADTASGCVDAESIKANADQSSTAGSFSLTGLKANTTYYVYIVAEDTEGHLGTLQAASFTTKEESKSSSGGSGSGGNSGSSGNSSSGGNNGSSNSSGNNGSSSGGNSTGNSSNGGSTNEGRGNGGSTAASAPARALISTPAVAQSPLILKSRLSGGKTCSDSETEENAHASDHAIASDSEPMDGSAADDEGAAASEDSDAGSDTDSNTDTDSSADSDNEDESSTAAATDEESAWSPLWILLTGAAVIAIGAGVFLAAKKKREE